MVYFSFPVTSIFAAIQNTMPNLTNMYQNIEKEHQDGFSSSRKASSKLERKSDKTTVQSIELKNDDMDIDEKIHFEKIIEGKSENEDDGFKKEYAVMIRRVIDENCFHYLILC